LGRREEIEEGREWARKEEGAQERGRGVLVCLEKHFIFNF
jgi:hypothetical protein